MSLSNRILLKAFLTDMLLFAFGLCVWWSIFVLPGIFPAESRPAYILTIFVSFVGIGYFLVKFVGLLWMFFRNVRYNQGIVRNRVSTAVEKFLRKPQKAQAFDLLNAVIASCNWSSFGYVNSLLADKSGRRIRAVLVQKPWYKVDSFLEISPKIELWFEGNLVAAKSLWK